MSMVIATFETSYDEMKDMITARSNNIRVGSRYAAFYLMTWSAPVHTTADSRMFKEMSQSSFNAIMTSLFQHFIRKNAVCDVSPMLLFNPSSSPIPEEELELVQAHRVDVMPAVGAMSIIADDDDTSSIDFSEFHTAIQLARCASVLATNPLLAAKAMLAKATTALNNTCKRIASTPVQEHAERCRFIKIKAAQQQILQEVSRVHAATVKQLVDLVGITPNFSLDNLDSCVVLFILLHCFVLSTWSSVTERDLIKGFSIFASVMYCLEVVVRVKVMRGFGNFFNDRRGQLYTFENKSALFLSIVGMSATIINTSTEGYDDLFQVLSASQLWRIFVINRSFRGIAYSFVIGLVPIRVFVLLLIVVMYVYTVVAHALFDSVSNEDGTMSFMTLEDSCLAMYQAFLGEGWHGIMVEAVEKTNKALIWFFASYGKFCSPPSVDMCWQCWLSVCCFRISLLAC